ncbi:P-loop containing nucleoside triphosphate hydrolase protein [Phakopsora pachyrhizi]|uniref:P-loop containing nucleoside triphosphate hydrolase protein n=2 Tax=Phakopsora pachyrhizi TaxID=170000 RepID=A0AAV0BMQ9_PHAPC|nr:P-loop containing nucleoside triphosphate hydrolase protein [Phakopsora pachyrhizi]CAH7687258.1 P-loop containing nucleoside triphosphate hydrolase protein [Phakopsora pachyrhizi]
MKEYKIVIMGGGGVGKSALTVQFVHDMFVERYDPTIEDSYRKMVTVDGNKVTVEILDTAGTEQFVALHSLYVKSGDGFLLVFALNTLDSIHELEALHESIVRIKEAEGYTEKIPIVLCGNKCDLEERTVQRSWAVGLSQDWGGVPYYETSARKRINVEEVIADLIRQIIKADRLGHLDRSGHRNRTSSRKRRHKKINTGCSIL